MIEGVFVTSPELQDATGGFHATFFVSAMNANNALKKVSELLRERMSVHLVSGGNDGPYASYYWVFDIWEISDEKFISNEGKDLGFTFFMIGLLDRYIFAFRRLYYLKFRNWVLVKI